MSTSLAESVNEEPSHGDAVVAPEPTINPLGTLAVISLASSKPVDGDFADAVFDADIDLDLGSINPLEAVDPKAEAEQALGLGEAEADTESELSAEPALEDKASAAEAETEPTEAKEAELATEATEEVSATVAATATSDMTNTEAAVAEATFEPALEDEVLAAEADADTKAETIETKEAEPTTEAIEEVSAQLAATVEAVEAKDAAVVEATAESALEDKALGSDAKADADSKPKPKAEQQEAVPSQSEPVEGSLMDAFGDDFDAILAPEHHEEKPHKKPKSKSKKGASAKKAAKAQESSDELGSQGSLGEGQLLS